MQKEWQQNNPDRLKIYNSQHRNHKITNNEWEACKNYFNYRCAYCGLPIEEHYIKFKGKMMLGDFHREHVDDCGANDLSNCIPSCKSCNISKHTYQLNEWYNEGNENFTKERLDKIHNWLDEDYKKYIDKK